MDRTPTTKDRRKATATTGGRRVGLASIRAMLDASVSENGFTVRKLRARSAQRDGLTAARSYALHGFIITVYVTSDSNVVYHVAHETRRNVAAWFVREIV